LLRWHGEARFACRNGEWPCLCCSSCCTFP
jgi:hypothetical protein